MELPLPIAGRLPGPKAKLSPAREIAGGEVRYQGISEHDLIEVTASISEFGYRDRSHRICLAPALSGMKQLPLFQEDKLPREAIIQHYDGSVPPSVYVYGLKDHELGGGGFLQSNGRIFTAPDVVPSYFSSLCREDGHSLGEGWAGALFRSQAKVVQVDGPIAVVLHPNLVYGHFLLEMLPRLHLLSRLRSAGAAFGIAIPTKLSTWVKRIIGIYFDEDEILEYDAETTRVRSSCFIAPSMMHTNYQFHPDFNLAIDEIKAFVLPQIPQSGKRRIWISRTKLAGWHGIVNEREVEETALSMGFDLIHPQELSFAEQVSLFHGADCIVGEFGSGLHNAIFAQRGARVFCLNRINWYQSGIASLRSQHLAYMLPKDGRFRDWRTQNTQDAFFEIDCKQLSEELAQFFS